MMSSRIVRPPSPSPDDRRHRRHLSPEYLILIEAIDLLPRLYKKIIIPDEVLGELIDEMALRARCGNGR